MPRDEDERIYRKHAEELTRFATFLVGPDEAPDVVSSAVLRTLSSPGWSRVEHHRAYLFRAVLNEARMHHRSTARRHAREQRSARPEGVEEIDTLSDVLDMVGQLSPRQRAVLYLAYWDDLGPASIADVLGVSEGSVRRHLARGRAALRRMLDDR
jgi:RNA polymerase sigma-70 factor (ECF subfamily)